MMIDCKYLESNQLRERGLEPLWFNPLDPKSSASASSATLASPNIKGFSVHLSIAQNDARLRSQVSGYMAKEAAEKTLYCLSLSMTCDPENKKRQSNPLPFFILRIFSYALGEYVWAGVL